MKSEFISQRYEVHLPVSVWTPNHILAHGMTEFISSHDIRFSLDHFLPLEKGAPIALRVNLPPELTGGDQVQLRASGQVLSVERSAESSSGQLSIVATLDWYDFARGDTPGILRASDMRHKEVVEFQRRRAATS